MRNTSLAGLAGKAIAGLALASILIPLTATAQYGSTYSPYGERIAKPGSKVNIRELSTALEAGASRLQPGFNCPPGESWNQNVAFPACVGIPAISGPRACNSEPVSWTGPTGAKCTGNAPVRDDGQTAPVSALGDYSGSATALCVNGYWTTTGAATCTPPPCPAISLQWQIGSAYCQANASSSSNGMSITLNSNNNNTGSATFMCHNGAWGAPSGVSCSAPYVAPAISTSNPPPLTAIPIVVTPTCAYPDGKTPGATWTWQNPSGSASCSGPLPTLPGIGGTATVYSTNGNNGSFSARCNSDGSMATVGTPSCEAPVSNQCGIQDISWTGSTGALCSARTGIASYGQTLTLYPNNGLSGQADVTCNAGTWSAPSNPKCIAPEQGCNGGGTLAWLNCAGPGPASGMADGASFTANNNVYGYKGSANYTCSKGAWIPNGLPTCDPVADQPCSNPYLTWGSCWGNTSTGTTPNGSFITAGNQAPGFTGSGRFFCNNGNWVQVYGDTTCNPIAPPAGRCELQEISHEYIRATLPEAQLLDIIYSEDGQGNPSRTFIYADREWTGSVAKLAEYGISLPPPSSYPGSASCGSDSLVNSIPGMIPIAIGTPSSDYSNGRAIFCTPETTDQYITQWYANAGYLYSGGLFGHRGKTTRPGLLKVNGGFLQWNNDAWMWNFGTHLTANYISCWDSMEQTGG